MLPDCILPARQDANHENHSSLGHVYGVHQSHPTPPKHNVSRTQSPVLWFTTGEFVSTLRVALEKWKKKRRAGGMIGDSTGS